ncbi:MAG: winged helix-turn-helix transcriptional regulator [Planctomycetes bacterium]|nr:winged helix-turn-helix transcriptional regulator [Planctomycetota bacterium]
MRDFLAVAKALADRNRVRALIALKRGKLCVCQIIELLGLAPSTVSKPMATCRPPGSTSLNVKHRRPIIRGWLSTITVSNPETNSAISW